MRFVSYICIVKMNKEIDKDIELEVDEKESTKENYVPKPKWDDEYDNWHPHF